jgi:hypothetical protein
VSVLRRLVALSLLALVVGLGVATATTPGPVDDDHAQTSCVTSVECSGASVLVGVGLAVVLPTLTSGPHGRAPITRLVTRPRTLHPRLAGSRLYRPPRPS